MRVLVATDGSPSSAVALEKIATRPWAPGTEVEIVSVAHSTVPYLPEPTLVLATFHHEMLEQDRQRVAERLERAAARLSAIPGLTVVTKALEGDPKEAIVREAEAWGADLVVVGSHGYGPVHRFLLGSVSLAVALHAPCSVEIVRIPRPPRHAAA
jgi:nucleotide-binding universal stress UspA family protein